MGAGSLVLGLLAATPAAIGARALAAQTTAAAPAASGWAGLGSEDSVPVRLVASAPTSYAAGYQAAENNLDGLLQPGGQVAAAPGAQAWVAAAFDLTGDPGRAQEALGWLLARQGADGSWAGDPGATGVALWALAEHARLGPGAGYLHAHWAAIRAAAGYLVAHQDPATGAIGPAGGPYPAFGDGEALLGLRAARAAAVAAGQPGSARAWAAALRRGTAGLQDDAGLAHQQPADFFANALFGPGTGSLLQRREVAGATELSLTYPGWGVKAGPGWYDGMDWVSAQATFLYVLAAARNGLPGQAGSQYDGGLRLQCPDGSIGAQYHPPAGLQTGGFQAGPSCSSAQANAENTALYLLATTALLGIHAAEGGARATPHLPPTWDQATVRIAGQAAGRAGGRTLTLDQRRTVDPVVPFASRRVAVVTGTSNGNESGLAMSAAYEALSQGYLPWVFWYLNSGDSNDGYLYGLSGLFGHLSRYAVIVVGDDALAGPAGGAYACSGGACPSPTPLRFFQQNSGALAAWVRAGGRLVSLGDGAAVPLPGALAAQAASAPSPIEQVTFTPAAGGLRREPYRLTSASVSGWSPGTGSYYSATGGYTVLAEGQAGSQAEPVMIGQRDGRGRVLQTTLGVSSAAHAFGTVAADELAWVTQGLPAPPAPPAGPSGDGRLAGQAAAAISPGWWDPAVSRYVAPPGTQDACPDAHASVWPVSQVYAAGLDLGSASLTAQATRAMAQYYGPAVGAYQDCPPHGTFYYDDNGWLLNDMMAEYSRTHAPGLLQRAETLFGYLETGWLPAGGEQFYPGCDCAEQVATGNFLQAALRLYRATGTASYLTWAQKISAWDDAHPEAGPDGNGLYYDTITNGAITDYIQFTYDTGVMVESDVLWYQVTRDPEYLVKAERLATAASAAFVNPADGTMEQASASGPAFNSIYLQAAADLAAVDGNARWLQPGVTSARAAALWDQQPGPAGPTYGANWDGVNASYDPGHLDVLTQAGTARLFAILAGSLRGR